MCMRLREFVLIVAWTLYGTVSALHEEAPKRVHAILGGNNAHNGSGIHFHFIIFILLLVATAMWLAIESVQVRSTAQ